MAANTSPVFPAGPKAWPLHLHTAVTARDGSGNLHEFVNGGDNGARIDRIVINAEGITHLGQVRFWFEPSGESGGYLLHEVALTASNPVGQTAVQTKEWSRADGEPIVLLGPGDQLGVTYSFDDVLDIVAFGGLY